MRLFIALDVAEQVRARVAEVIEQEKAKVEAKWVRVEGLHLTLIFLGETTEARMKEVVAVSRPVGKRHPPFSLSLEGAGTFGPPAHPRVLWVGAGGALDPLRDLVTQLEAALDVVSDHPTYTPHLTLARSTPANGDPRLSEVAARLHGEQFGRWVVDHFTLYQSAGGRYRALETMPLQ